MANRFANVTCSHCGRDFGPGDHGFSHCDSHPGHVRDRKLARQAAARKAAETRRRQGKIAAALSDRGGA